MSTTGIILGIDEEVQKTLGTEHVATIQNLAGGFLFELNDHITQMKLYAAVRDILAKMGNVKNRQPLMVASDRKYEIMVGIGSKACAQLKEWCDHKGWRVLPSKVEIKTF